MTRKKTETSPNLVSGYARLLRRRDRGGVVFYSARYAEKDAQLFITRDQTEKFDELRKLPLGTLISFTGIEEKTTVGIERYLILRAVTQSQNASALPDKWHGLSPKLRYKRRTLDLMTNEAAFLFSKFISQSTSCIRTLLCRAGYCEFNTGTLQSEFEAGLAKPFATKANFNGHTYYLSLTSELKLKRLIIAGFDQVFEIAQSFRNEGVNPICSPEHTLLEAYAVGKTCNEQMELLELLTRSVAEFSGSSQSIAYIDANQVSYALDFQKSYHRISFQEAYAKYVDGTTVPTLARLIELYPSDFESGMARYTWLMKVIESIIAPNIIQPTFLTDLPNGMSPFVKSSASNPNVSERSFFLCGGMFLADIYTDENDYNSLQEALKQQEGKERKSHGSEFSELLKYGMPPTSGFGLGLKRFSLLFRGHLPFNIKETILYPL